MLRRLASPVLLAAALLLAGCDAMKDLFATQRAVSARFGTTSVNLTNDDLTLTVQNPALFGLDAAAQKDSALAVARLALGKLAHHSIRKVTVTFQQANDFGPVHVSRDKGSYSWTADELRQAPAHPSPGRPSTQ
jgi:hypothetical protein